MQGLITLDFGNSHPHAGLFQKNHDVWHLIKIVPWEELPLYLSQLEFTPNNSSLALCEVKAREEELLPYLQQGFLITRVKDYWRGERFHGMPVHYSKSLGEDRLINAFHAWKKEKIPTLIIDAGTFTTLDVISETGYQGGYILPGFRNYFSLFSQGEQLRDIHLTPTFNSTLPQTTAQAMTDGYQAMGRLAQNLIKEQKIQKIILTGGQGSIWSNLLLLKPDIKVENDPDYIHRAIHFWMTTQIEPL